MNAVDYKCPSCSAVLHYNAETQSWKCEYCSTEYKLEDLEKNEVKYEKANAKKMDVDEYSCPNCGAKIIADENTTATFCVYCGSTAIIKSRLTDMLEPDKVIPFKTTKEQAIEAFKKSKKGKLFAPKDFAKKEQIDKLTAVYIPFWIYDTSVDASVEGTGTKVSSWSSGDYRYTKTDTYRVARRGSMAFDNVPVDASKKFDDDTMDSIEPFDYREVKEFSPAYLSGFLAEKYDVEKDEAFKRAKLRMENTVKDILQSDIGGYTSVAIRAAEMKTENDDVEYVLFPVWMLNIKYKNKMHTFAMNGQTGRMVGNVPISVGKLFAWWGGSFAAIFGLIAAFMMIGG